MAPPGTARRLSDRRPTPETVRDTAVATAALVATLLLISHGGIDAVGPGPALRIDHLGSKDLDATGVLLAVGSTLPLVFWRRSPFGVFVVTATAGVLLAGLGYQLGVMLGASVALYLLAASRGPKAPWTKATTVTVVAMLVAYVIATITDKSDLPNVGGLLHAGLPWAVGWFAGERTRLRHQHIANLTERASRAELEAERERQLAVAEERARIARDLHDSAAHSINVIAVRAGAGRLGHPRNPDSSLAALEAIEEQARQTADEIDHIVRTLRTESQPTAEVQEPAGMASLDTLIANHTATGLDVTVDTVGEPRQLARSADQAAYRIVQEALTNATRHGTGSAHLAVAFDSEVVEVTVTNPVTTPRPPPERHGHGLIGMHERATLLGGSLDIESTNGTFCVRARIPYRGPST